MSENPAPRKGGSLRRKATVGAGLAILGLGIWLGSWLKGLGLGEGVGRPGEAETASDGAPADPGEVSVDLGNPADIRASSAADTSEQQARTVAVMVTGDGYRLPEEPVSDPTALSVPVSRHFATASIEQVVEQAKAATGNASGIRVLVLKHNSSTVGAHSTLVTALKEAGIPEGTIHVYTGFFD